MLVSEFMALDKEKLLKTKGESGALPLNQILEKIIDEINGGNWIDLTLNEGVSVGSIYGALRYKKIGNHVFLEGDVAFTASATSVVNLTTLPVGVRPKKNIYSKSFCSGARLGRTYITSSGTVGCDWIYDLGTNKRIEGNIPWYEIKADFLVD